MPAASSRTPSSIPTRGWIRFSIACAKPSPRAASPRASTWTTPRSTARRGRPLGPARIAASIGILIIHTPPYQPEGRGKIERFFRSVREQFLAGLDPKALLSIEQLNERLWHWLDTVYHRHEHGALRTTPPHLAGQRIEVRFDPLDLAQLEIYCEGQPEGVARLVDVVVNGRTCR